MEMCIRDSVKEDVTEIVLNLKNVILKIHDEMPKTLYIEASGEGEIDVYKRQAYKNS